MDKTSKCSEGSLAGVIVSHSLVCYVQRLSTHIVDLKEDANRNPPVQKRSITCQMVRSYIFKNLGSKMAILEAMSAEDMG